MKIKLLNSKHDQNDQRKGKALKTKGNTAFLQLGDLSIDIIEYSDGKHRITVYDPCLSVVDINPGQVRAWGNSKNGDRKIVKLRRHQ